MKEILEKIDQCDFKINKLNEERSEYVNSLQKEFNNWIIKKCKDWGIIPLIEKYPDLFKDYVNLIHIEIDYHGDYNNEIDRVKVHSICELPWECHSYPNVNLTELEDCFNSILSSFEDYKYLILNLNNHGLVFCQTFAVISGEIKNV